MLLGAVHRRLVEVISIFACEREHLAVFRSAHRLHSCTQGARVLWVQMD